MNFIALYNYHKIQIFNAAQQSANETVMEFEELEANVITVDGTYSQNEESAILSMQDSDHTYFSSEKISQNLTQESNSGITTGGTVTDQNNVGDMNNEDDTNHNTQVQSANSSTHTYFTRYLSDSRDK